MNQSFAILKTQLDALLASNTALIEASDRVIAALAAARAAGSDMTPEQAQELVDAMANQAEANDAAKARADAAAVAGVAVKPDA